jgi:hypothetical protein
MAYSNTAAVPRSDIRVLLEQAREADKGLIADKVLGVYSSDETTGRYPRYNIGNGGLLDADTDTKRAPGTGYKRINRSYEWDTFDCEDRGLEEAVDETDARKVKKFFDMEVSSAQKLRRNTALAYEQRVATKVMSAANSGFTAANSVVAYTEANLATIDLPRDIQEAKQYLTARGVNQEEMSLVMSNVVYDRLRRSPKLLSYVFGNHADVGNKRLNLAELADALEVKEILLGTRSRNSAKKGTTLSLSAIWGTSTVLLANLKSGEFSEGGIGRTIVWTEDASGLYVAESYRDETNRSDIVRVRQNSTEKVTDVNEGYLITTQWA